MLAIAAELKTARANANSAYQDSGKNVNHPAYVEAMVIVKYLCTRLDAAAPKEEFCSVDSGMHRRRLANGRKI